MKIYRFFILVFIGAGFLGTAGASDYPFIQSGPGVLGPLVPLGSPSGIRVLSENTHIALTENGISAKGLYHLYNGTTGSITLKVGVPTIKTEGGTYPSLGVTFSAKGKTFPTEVLQGENLELGFDISPYVPIQQRFSVARVWHATEITIPPKGKLNLQVEAALNFLSVAEELKGRRDESPKLFFYDWARSSLWQQPITRSTILIHPKLDQLDRLTVAPSPQNKEDVPWRYLIQNRIPGSQDNIMMVYDPLVIAVTPFGFKGKPRPQTLDGQDGKVYSFDHLFDGRLDTCWCEGEQLGGENLAFEVSWGKNRRLDSVEIFPGYSDNRHEFKQHNRLKKVNLYLSQPGWISEPIPVEFPDQAQFHRHPLPPRQKASLLIFQIKEIYVGDESDATCIAEIKINMAP
jgi:hypothetical protein